VNIEVLGSVRARLDGPQLPLGPPLRQAVLAVLALRANRTVSRDEIVDAVWGDEPPASAVNAVHVHVAELRRVLEPGRDRRGAARVLTGAGSGYLLSLPPGGLDADLFAQHLRRARRLADEGHVAAAVEAYDDALRLWRGTALSGVPGPLAEVERNRLAELRLAALEDRAEAMLDLGRHAGFVAELSALAAEHPLRERLRGLLMTALYRDGRQADALAVYADTRRLLIEELGIEPGPELRGIHQRVLTGEPVSAGGRRGARVRSAAVPRQLPAPARHFVGRTVEVALLHRLADEAARRGGPVVISAIGGTGGIGKTAIGL